MAASFSSSISLFCIIGLLFSVNSEPQSAPPLVDGLSYTFYDSKCPDLESIVRNHLRESFNNDIGLAAGLLRIHFHDCFVKDGFVLFGQKEKGCDASVLLEGPKSEQKARPNQTLRPSALKAINDLRSLINKACRQIVSCADVVALAARDSVALFGGPDYRVPLGRRDGLTPATKVSLPSPTSNVSTLLSVFGNLNLDATDLVTLSGGHTIGLAHCTSFEKRLYPTQDADMDKTYASNLRLTCPTINVTNTTVNDIRSPNAFDNQYYVNLMNRQGLFTSDQDLYSDSRTRSIVTSFAVNQRLFFEKFAYSMIKMGQLGVLTGSQGEIRTNCSARNVGKKYVGKSKLELWSVVGDLGGRVAF